VQKARIIILGVTHHVIRRGHNRQVVFAIEEDFQCYLANLLELKNAFGVKLYAIAGRATGGDRSMSGSRHPLDPCYEALGATEQLRRNRYREFEVGVLILRRSQK